MEFEGEIDRNPLPNNSKLIYSKKRNIKEVVSSLLKNSDTFAAEMLLRALGLKYFNKPSSAQKGLKLIDSLITKVGLNSNHYKIVDGSGISHYNLITTELLIELFRYLKINSPNIYNLLYDSFPISGIDGTLANRASNINAYNNTRAKTGTIAGVSNIAGFIRSADDHEIGFAIFIQNFVEKPYKARHYQDIICGYLSELELSEFENN